MSDVSSRETLLKAGQCMKIRELYFSSAKSRKQDSQSFVIGVRVFLFVCFCFQCRLKESKFSLLVLSFHTKKSKE